MDQEPQTAELPQKNSRLGWVSFLSMGLSTLLTLAFFIAWFVYTIKFQPRGAGIAQSDDQVAPVLGSLVFLGVFLQLVSGVMGAIALFQRGSKKLLAGIGAGCGCLLIIGLALLAILAVLGVSV